MLKVYQSSAGSGKTYTLAREYIKFALRTPTYFKHILAVTFTNKAAEEMKNRVIEFLKKLSVKEHELLSFYAKEFAISEDEVAQKANDSLLAILHNYSEFNISTIDSFFHKVVRSFAKEIGLQGSFQLEMDTQKVVDKLTEKLFEEVENEPQLKKWLFDFSLEKLGNESSYDVRSDIEKLAHQLFSEDFKKLPNEAFYEENFKETLLDFLEKIKPIIPNFENPLKEIGEDFFKIIEKSGIELDDFKRGKSRIIPNIFKKLKNIELDSWKNKTALNCLENSENWVTKTSKKKDEIMALAEAKLMPLLQKAFDFYDKNHRDYFTAKQAIRYFYSIGLLSNLSQKLKEYRAEEDAVLLSDLPDFLTKIIGDDQTPFIYEKVGSKYFHFLIDEFQDTSAFQWQNFKPLLEESLANGHESLIVGDSKQSIYKFRGGDPSILSYQVQKDIPQAEICKLDTNYRSTETIVRFNNELFSGLPDVIEQRKGADLGEIGIEKIKNTYKDVAQKPHKKDKIGRVELSFIKPEEDEKYDEIALEKSIELVENLKKEGYQASDIAFLVRTKREAIKIAEGFIKHKNRGNEIFDIITAEGLLLNKSTAVRIIILALKHLNNPKDEMVIFELKDAYFSFINDVTKNHEYFANISSFQLPNAFTKHKHHLKNLPIYELSEVLIRVFDLGKKDHSYIQTFQDQVLVYAKNGRPDISGFLEWWEEQKDLSVQLTSQNEQIEILTLHKSKGLQYPIVIMPFCDFNLDSKSNINWYYTDNQTFNQIPLLPALYSNSLLKTHFSDQYQEQMGSWYLEHLNMLYVSFTRAETGLYVFSQEPSAYSKTFKISHLLLQYFQTKQPDGWTDESKTYISGELPKVILNEKKEQKPREILEEYPSYKWSNRLKIKKIKNDLLDEKAQRKINEGILLHQILSEIIDYTQSGEVLDKYQAEMLITSDERDIYSRLFDELWENTTIKSWFEVGNEVKTEVLVLPKKGEYKRLDRVVIQEKTAKIIDFKSGKPKESDETQMKEYISLVEEMGYQTEGFLLYLSPINIQKITK